MTSYRKAAADYLARHDGALRAARAGDAGAMEWSDVWLLHAVKVAARGERGAMLEQIFAAGDFLSTRS